MSLIQAMADALIMDGVDLGDEAAVLTCLRNSRFDEYCIIPCMQEAIEKARVIKSETAEPE